MPCLDLLSNLRYTDILLMFTSLKAMPCSRVQPCPVRLTLRCVNLKNRNSKVTKREFKNVKKELFCVKLRGRHQKAAFASVDRFRDRLVSFCGKASGVNCPVARSFVVEAKFVYLAPKLGSFFSTDNFYSPPND